MNNELLALADALIDGDVSATNRKKAAALIRSMAEQEPVAHICILPTKDAGPTKFFTAPSDPRGFPVYAAPVPTREPLTELSVMKIIGDEFPLALVEPIIIRKIKSVCRAIESAYGIGAKP
jgi:hypothetical protein